MDTHASTSTLNPNQLTAIAPEELSAYTLLMSYFQVLVLNSFWYTIISEWLIMLHITISAMLKSHPNHACNYARLLGTINCIINVVFDSFTHIAYCFYNDVYNYLENHEL